MLALLVCWGQAWAQFSLMDNLPGEKAPALMQVEGAASVHSYQKGKPFYLALQGHIQRPWHAYFRNPGTVGDPMTANLTTPKGFRIAGPFWEAPHRLEGLTGVSYAYSDPLFVWEVTPEEGAPENATFTLSCTAQLCNDGGCMAPETYSTTVKLQEGEGAPSPAWQQQELRTDNPAHQAAGFTATQEGNHIILHFPAGKDVSSAYFFSEDNSIAPTAEQTLVRTDQGTTLILTRNDGQDPMYPLSNDIPPGQPLSVLQGVLTYDQHHTLLKLPLAPPEVSAATTLPTHLPSIIWWLFLGGLILNLMPCVFPVIGLKIMSFVSLAGGSRRKIVLHSLSFVMGILVSFWLLTLLLIIFSNLEVLAHTPWHDWAAALWNDAGSTSRNWAAWMQNEWIVYAILLLLLILGMSMFGIFEIGTGATGAGQSLQQKGGMIGSFFQGLLVTVVATPCSAPFLGAAMPAAMSLPGMWMLLALTFMALGLALPYIILGLFPSLVRMLPRPGAWMESLKQGLSFFLFAAAAWMLDVYMAFWPEQESHNMVWMLMSLVLICAAFWVYGRWCPMYRSRACRLVALVIALGMLSIGILYSMPRYPLEQSKEGNHPAWQEWSEHGVEAALNEGRSVYVDFTAKWCATCQMNKKVAYTDAVYQLMAQHGVVLMRADKTRPNPDIDAAMRRLNRSAVPVNALYMPGKQPVVTKELLTPDYLLEFLRQELDHPPATHDL